MKRRYAMTVLSLALLVAAILYDVAAEKGHARSRTIAQSIGAANLLTGSAPRVSSPQR